MYKCCNISNKQAPEAHQGLWLGLRGILGMGGIGGMGGISANGRGDMPPPENDPTLGLKPEPKPPDRELPRLLGLCIHPACLLAAKPWLRPCQVGLDGARPTGPFAPPGLPCCHQGLG